MKRVLSSISRTTAVISAGAVPSIAVLIGGDPADLSAVLGVGCPVFTLFRTTRAAELIDVRACVCLFLSAIAVVAQTNPAPARRFSPRRPGSWRAVSSKA